MSQPLAPGRMVAHFRIQRKLGAGGMGQVWLAHDTQLDRPVALKFLPTELAADPDRSRRFLREAKAAAAISHPNVAQIYEIGDADGLTYLALEYVDGKTLSVSGKLGMAEILDVAVQTVSALEDAHGKGIIHRDIKPANIMIDKRGLVKVLDFGLAKVERPAVSAPAEQQDTVTEPLTATDAVMGTLHYMSPEQALGEDVDTRTDLFSLGIVLYQMASGRRPFGGETPGQAIAHILQMQPPPLAGRVPQEFDRMVRKCLEKKREQRYQTARDLLVDLKNLQRDSPRPAPAAPRNAWLAAAVGLVLAAGTGAYLLRQPSGVIDSLAVLPLAVTSAEPNLEYLGDGLTQEVIETLSMLPQVKVKSWNAVQRYKGKGVDAVQAGAQLQVRGVLAGQLTQRGQTVALSVELIDTSDGGHLWGGQYTETLAGLQSLKQRVASEVAGRLKPAISADERRLIAKRHTEDPEAYHLYLRGRYHADKLTPDDWKKGVEYLREATSKDPKFALAHSALTEALFLAGDWYLPNRDALGQGRVAITKALEADPGLAEAHSFKGCIDWMLDQKFAEAEREFQRGIQLNPDDPRSRVWYSFFLNIHGRFDEAEAQARHAIRLDPVRALNYVALGLTYYHRRQWDAAASEFGRSIEIDAAYSWGRLLQGWSRLQQGRLTEARALFEKAYSDAPVPEIKAAIAYADVRAGRPDLARKAIQELEALKKSRFVPAADFAVVYLGLGDRENSLRWIERAIEERNYVVMLFAYDPRFDLLRGEPRFEALVAKWK